VLVIEHETHAGLDLMTVGLGADLQVIRPYLGDRLPDGPTERERSAGYAGLIVLGGSMGALDDDVAPWLPGTRRLIADAVQQQVPTLGICLGAQLLAVACGGTVQRGSHGLEVGLVPITPLAAAAADPFFSRVSQLTAGRPDQDWPAFQYHFDAVTRLPANAELMVTGERYPHQGFRVGPAAWAVQYHPEVSTAEFAGWVQGGVRSGEIAADAAATLLAPIRAAEQAQRRMASAHALAFCDLVKRAADESCHSAARAEE
jgi:GMP synthase (glutamine-hydrolysing)